MEILFFWSNLFKLFLKKRAKRATENFKTITAESLTISKFFKLSRYKQFIPKKKPDACFL